MWGLIVVHSKQVFHFNCVHFNEVPLYVNIPYSASTQECVMVHIVIFIIQLWFLIDEVEEDACPIGWESSVCASACQPTCEGYLRPQLRSTACITVCAKCQCPFGMVVFRGRCVDPLECYILLNGI